MNCNKLILNLSLTRGSAYTFRIGIINLLMWFHRYQLLKAGFHICEQEHLPGACQIFVPVARDDIG